ncbi:G patch domain-containing protein 2 isoform X1 [Mobula hypostoma]|uniref:G patch domain-containing protein 2 isoform X1 n=1 Tax=Mobula hypostoma TaxID=723540 RepID=UPI002FC35CF2
MSSAADRVCMILTDWPCREMDELVQDLVSALEETSEHTRKYANFEGEASRNSASCLLMRQTRKRKVRKRRMDIGPQWCEYSHCMSDVSESSLEGTTRDNRENNNYSDSDDHLTVTKRLSSLNMTAIRGKRHSWHESDSITDSNLAGRSLRRRRKVKRMAVDSPAEVTNTLHPLTQGKVPATTSERHQAETNQLHFHLQVQEITKDKIIKRKRLEVPDEGVVVESEEICTTNRDKMENEERKVSDDSMSDSESSSLSSSDGGLFTNDEGRQGDDEQSDWFFEGESGGACAIARIIPWWEHEDVLDLEKEMPDPVFKSILTGTFPLMSQTAQRGFQTRLSQLAGMGNRNGRKETRKLPTKHVPERERSFPCQINNPEPGINESLVQFSQEPRHQDLWLCPTASEDHSQFGYQQEVHKDRTSRKSNRSQTSTRQTNAHFGSLCTGDIKRRRRAAPPPGPLAAVFVGENASPIPETNIGSRMLQTMGWIPGTGLGPNGSGIAEPMKALWRPKGVGLGFC